MCSVLRAEHAQQSRDQAHSHATALLGYEQSWPVPRKGAIAADKVRGERWRGLRLERQKPKR